MRYLRAVLVAAAAASILAVGSEARAATTPITTCGQTVTTSAVLTHDLTCPGGAGVIVGASGITIDLKGFVLWGDRTAGKHGIDDSAGFGGIKVQNGVARNFDNGLSASGPADSVSVSNLVVSGNLDDGIEILGDKASIRSSTASGNGFDGIRVDGASTSIKSVTASGNAHDGILLQGGSASIASATGSGNGLEGITVSGDSASIASTTASGNGDVGVTVNGNSASIRSVTASGNPNGGIDLVGDSGSISSSTASGNPFRGVFVNGASVTIKSVTASGNGSHGIDVTGDTAVLTGNRAEANGFPGGVSDTVGLGIVVSGFTTPPVGKNVARGNDAPSECNPSSLC